MGCSHHFFFKMSRKGCREQGVLTNQVQVSPTIPPFDCYQTAYLLRLRVVHANMLIYANLYLQLAYA